MAITPPTAMKISLHLAAGCAAALLCSSCEREADASSDVRAPGGASTKGGSTPPGTPEGVRKPYEPMTDEELRAKLTPLQYRVTKQEGTERAYTGKYDKHYEEGIYVCIISGEPLFSSKDKYDSGCGWPAFTKPIDDGEIVRRTDFKIGYPRTEVRAKTGDSHLGHVFEDGPTDKGGLRYCINSASLRFVPKDKLAEEGYGEYLKLFANSGSDDGGSK